MEYKKHIEYFEKEIQFKLEQLPRAIRGKAPMSELERIVDEIEICKTSLEYFLRKNNE